MGIQYKNARLRAFLYSSFFLWSERKERYRVDFRKISIRVTRYEVNDVIRRGSKSRNRKLVRADRNGS